jgi:hypothetical protein
VESFRPCDEDKFQKLLNESLPVRYNRGHAEPSRITNTFSGVVRFLAAGASSRSGRPEEKLRTLNKITCIYLFLFFYYFFYFFFIFIYLFIYFFFFYFVE